MSAPARRVLIIDDDPHIRKALAYALGDDGYQVDEATDGSAALELVATRCPDVILLDMRMPGMDGWEFARRYRQRYGRRTPILVMTAARDAAARSAEIDAESFLAKPFDLAALLERVAALAVGGEPRADSR